MGHIAAQTVLVDHKGVDGHIPEQVVDVEIGLQLLPLACLLEGGHHPFMVSIGGVGDFPFPDGGIAVEVIVGII